MACSKTWRTSDDPCWHHHHLKMEKTQSQYQTISYGLSLWLFVVGQVWHELICDYEARLWCDNIQQRTRFGNPSVPHNKKLNLWKGQKATENQYLEGNSQVSGATKIQQDACMRYIGMTLARMQPHFVVLCIVFKVKQWVWSLSIFIMKVFTSTLDEKCRNCNTFCTSSPSFWGQKVIGQANMNFKSF